ncbi:MAG: hypothetical protein AAGA32_16075 [Pseudomonadota bacterium]
MRLGGAGALNRRLTQMRKTLDRQRSLLLSGKFEDAARGSDELTRLIHDVERTAARTPDVDAALVDGVRHAAGRNTRMLEAARKGVAAAKTRLAAIRAQRSSLNTYTRGGERRDLARPAPTVEKRS